MRTVAIFALLLVVIATGCGPSVTVQGAKVRRGAIREFVDEQGKTRLPDVYEITMPYAGRIRPIELREGQAVKQGEVLAQIDQGDLDLEIAEARANVERLEASLVENDDTSVEEGARQQALRYVQSMAATVSAADARKKSGQKRLDYAESARARVRNLFDKGNGAASKEELDRSELQFVEAEVDYQQDVLTAEAIRAIDAATRLMPQMVLDYINRKGLTHNVLAKQKAEAEAKLRTAERRGERGQMTSPIDGVVLERQERDEQFLQAGAILLKVGDLSQLEVEADVLSQEVVRVRPGQEVEIYGPAVGAAEGAGVKGKVARIYPAGFMKLSSLGVEQQRVKVIVEFADDVLAQLRDRGVGVDYRIRVRIFTAENADGVLIPRSAVFRGPDGGWQTFAIRGGVAKLQPIELGLMNDDTVEVTKGLAADEQVILSPENNLTDGTGVRAIVR